MGTLKIAPVNRIEGHMDVEATTDAKAPIEAETSSAAETKEGE